MDLADFTGRQGELAWLDLMLGEEGERATGLSVVHATGGAGKTALAVHWAHRAADQLPDGHLYVDLRGWADDPAARPIEALAQLLRALGVPAEEIPVELDEAAALYRSCLADRRALVLLDNARDAEQVRPLLPGGPGCVVVVTSRDRLAGLVASHGARLLALDMLTVDEASGLLARILGERLAGESRETVRALVAACAGLPLALRIVAANLAAFPDRPLADHAADLVAGNRLAALAVAGEERVAVRAAFDLSYQRLDVEEQELFRLLGLVPGPDFTLPAAAALAGTPAERTGRLLDRLTRVHLVEHRDRERFALHDLLRLYARERAERAAAGTTALAAATTRLFTWYLRTADSAAKLLYPHVLRVPLPEATGGPAGTDLGSSNQALAWLDAERLNLVAAAQHAAVNGPHDMAWLLADALRGYFWLRRATVDWLTTARAGLAAATDDGDLLAQAAAQLSIGSAHQGLGRHVQAVEAYTGAVTLARKAGWVNGEAAASGNLGVVHREMGQPERAITWNVEALALYRRSGRQVGEATTLTNLGNVVRERGQLDQALGHLTEALALYRRTGSRNGEADTLGNLGEVYRELGRLAEARERLTTALKLMRELGDRYGESCYRQALAAVEREAGRDAEAHTSSETALALAREIGDPLARIDCLNTAGSVQLRLGDPERALDDHGEALEVAREVGSDYREAVALIGLARASERLGRNAQALELAVRARSVAGGARYLGLHDRALAALAAANLAEGNAREAVDQARQAAAGHRLTGHRLARAEALLVVGHALHRAGEPAGAAAPWREALDLYATAGSLDATRVRSLLSEIPSRDEDLPRTGGHP